MKTPTLRLIQHMRVLRLRPGDVLVLRTKEHIHDEMAARLKQELGYIAPPGVKTLVLTGGFSLGVMRPDEPEVFKYPTS